MAVVGYYTGLSGMAVVENLKSFDVEVAESLGAFAVDACQEHRTYCRKPGNLDHKHIDTVVVSMSECVQSDRWQEKDQREVDQHSCLNAGADSILNAAVWENCALKMKKIEDLLVGVPYLWDKTHMLVAHPSVDLALEPGRAVGEPAVNLPKLDFGRPGVANSGKVRVLGSGPGMESCFDYLLAGSEVVYY